MKHFYLKTLMFFLLILICGRTNAELVDNYDYDCKINGILYKIIRNSSNKYAVVTWERYFTYNITEYAGWNYTDFNGIDTLVIPNSIVYNGEEYYVRTIGKNAFNGVSIKHIILPDSLRSIEEDAFRENKELVSIKIPQNVNYITGNPFVACYNLEEIIVEDGNSKYDSRDSCNAIIRTSNKEVVVGCQNSIIPDGIEGIGANAFYDCRKLKKIDLPNSITYIGSAVFSGCI